MAAWKGFLCPSVSGATRESTGTRRSPRHFRRAHEIALGPKIAITRIRPPILSSLIARYFPSLPSPEHHLHRSNVQPVSENPDDHPYSPIDSSGPINYAHWEELMDLNDVFATVSKNDCDLRGIDFSTTRPFYWPSAPAVNLLPFAHHHCLKRRLDALVVQRMSKPRQAQPTQLIQPSIPQ